jgi:GNAT superfamily N-acetyltransferase
MSIRRARPSIWLAQPTRQLADVLHFLLPMRSLGPAHKPRISQHLLGLSAHDRYLRFGYSASDEQVQRYVDELDFVRDEIFGVYNRRLELLAVAHLAFAGDGSSVACAEFGVSVAEQARGRGYGSRLFERALIHARNEGVQMLFIHALSENAPMLKIARKHGATLQRHGAETEAFLKLAAPDWESRLDEFIEDSVADIDFELKLQAKHFWSLLAELQALRASLPPQS